MSKLVVQRAFSVRPCNFSQCMAYELQL